MQVALGTVHEPDTLLKLKPTLADGEATYPAQLALTVAAPAGEATAAPLTANVIRMSPPSLAAGAIAFHKVTSEGSAGHLRGR